MIAPTIAAPAWAAVTIVGYVLCFVAIPSNAQTTTNPYATSLLVVTTREVMSTATAMIKIAHVSGLNPKPSQFTEASAVATLAMEAMVIQPR
jgi:hypothetical protein